MGPLRVGFDSIFPLEAGRRTIIFYLLLSFLRGGVQSVRSSRVDVVGQQGLRHLLDCDDVVVATSQHSSVGIAAVGQVSPQMTTSCTYSTHLPSWIHYYFLQLAHWTVDTAAVAEVEVVAVVHYV